MNYTLNDFINLGTGVFIGTVAMWSVFRPRRHVKLSKAYIVGELRADITVEAESAEVALSIMGRTEKLIEARAAKP